ncbi:MAG: bifunctional riboflavin kinase/FAD synthetase [Flavobacteriales bacterium]|nr:bifunctional riboflavin kinase/FAD synthetase [Flavobacteriales bacterium]
MKVYHSIEQFPSDIKSILTIGTFDGVHKGHQYVLDRLNEIAKKEGGESVLLTFYPHPRHVLHPDDQALKLLNSIEEKIKELEKSGLQHFIIHQFTPEFSRTKSINFIRDLLVNKLQMKYMVVGYDHHFGRNREGSYDDLVSFSELYDFKLEQIPPQDEGDVTVSSTKIRKLLLAGDIEIANTYLGYPYLLTGKVVKGNEIGRTISYPTANIALENKWKLIPADGVYAVKVVVGEMLYYGMLNIGNRPTISDGDRVIEVHVFNFSADIYGADIRVEFVKRVRDEKQFDSLGALKSQLKIDENKCRRYLGLL